MDNPWLDLPSDPPFIAPVDAPVLDAAFQARYHLECGLTPVPFVGDPHSARVILLQLNPGYATRDVEDEAEIDGFTQAIRAASVFKGDGFFPLDRRFKRTAAAQWWLARLRELIKKCGYDAIFRGLACIEFFPYHSEQSWSPPEVPSQDYTFEVLRSILAAQSIVVIMRLVHDWQRAVPEMVGHPRVLVNSHYRSGYVTTGTLGEGAFGTVVQALS